MGGRVAATELLLTLRSSEWILQHDAGKVGAVAATLYNFTDPLLLNFHRKLARSSKIFVEICAVITC